MAAMLTRLTTLAIAAAMSLPGMCPIGLAEGLAEGIGMFISIF